MNHKAIFALLLLTVLNLRVGKALPCKTPEERRYNLLGPHQPGSETCIGTACDRIGIVLAKRIPADPVPIESPGGEAGGEGGGGESGGDEGGGGEGGGSGDGGSGVGGTTEPPPTEAGGNGEQSGGEGPSTEHGGGSGTGNGQQASPPAADDPEPQSNPSTDPAETAILTAGADKPMATPGPVPNGPVQDPGTNAPAGGSGSNQAALTQKGQRNMDNLRAAISRSQDDDSALITAYQTKSNSFYTKSLTSLSSNSDAVPKFDGTYGQGVKEYLQANGIDFDDLNEITKVQVWGKPGLDEDGMEDTRTIFEAYANPTKGWMLITRKFRTSDASTNVEPLYVSTDQLPANQRITISEHIFQEWNNLAGGDPNSLPLTKIGDGGIENDDMTTLLAKLSPQVEVPAAGTLASNSPDFTEVMGGSVGSPVVHSLTDHHNDPVYNNNIPTSVSWHFTLDGGRSPTNAPNGVEYSSAEDRDAFMILTLGQ